VIKLFGYFYFHFDVVFLSRQLYFDDQNEIANQLLAKQKEMNLSIPKALKPSGLLEHILYSAVQSSNSVIC